MVGSRNEPTVWANTDNVAGHQYSGKCEQVRPSASKAAKLRAATFEDYQCIANLESRHGFRTRTYEDWKHFWINNPVYKHLDFHWPIGWVLEADNEIVGSFTNIPLRYRLGGQDILAAAGRAWVTDERYRSYAILLLGEFFSQKNVDLFLCTTVNRHAESALHAVDAKRVPVGAWDKAGFWITNYPRFARSVLAMRSKGFPIRLGIPFSAVLFARDKWRSKRLPVADKHRPVQCCLNLDERFDDFWEELKTRTPGRLLGNRSRAALDWHFRRALARETVWIATITERSRIVAYLIVSRKDNHKFGLTRMRIIDYQSLEDDISGLTLMLLWAYRRCREQRICILENIGWRLEPGNIMDALAPHQRSLPAWQFFYKAGSPGLEARLRDPSTWDASLFDGDSSL